MKKQRLTYLKKPLTELIMLVQRKKNQAIIVKFSTFRHRSLFYRARKNLKTYIKLLIYLTKKRFNLLLAAQSFIQGKKNVKYVYADINCILKIRFIYNDEKIFSSVGVLRTLFPEQLLSLYFIFLEVIFSLHCLELSSVVLLKSTIVF